MSKFWESLVSHGVAALLYDKRDVGADPSGMDLVDHHDLAGDALAAVALLKARDDIRDDQIGIWGVSQGSGVAAIAAAQSNDVAFVITVSAAGVSYAELYISAQEHTLRSRGFSDHEVSEATDAHRRLNEFVGASREFERPFGERAIQGTRLRFSPAPIMGSR